MSINSSEMPPMRSEPYKSMDEDASNEDQGPNMISCDTHEEVSPK